MALASLLLAPQLGWVATTTFAGQPGDSVLEIQARGGGLNRVWSMPSDESDSSNIGLGGGITYAWDPDLCGLLEPIFRENENLWGQINCADIQASVHRAFDAWASNSRFIKFNDVTHECEALGYMDPNSTERGFAPAVATLYGTMQAFTISLLTERIRRIQEIVGQEVAALSMLTRHSIDLYTLGYEVDDATLVKALRPLWCPSP